MRTALLATTLAMTFAANAGAAERMARLPVVGPFGADEAAAYVSDKTSAALEPAGHPYYARSVYSRHDRGDEIAGLGRSSLPFQIAVDPRGSERKRIAYSQCATPRGGGAPTCAILSRDLVTDRLQPTVLSHPAPAVRDRLPSAYAGAVAFSRSVPGAVRDELWYVPGAGGTARRLRGGPRGTGAARLMGVALRDTTIAYIWRWKPAAARTRSALFVEGVGRRPREVVALDSQRGRILGPVWRGARVGFAIRRGTASRLYDYAPGSGSFRSAPGPSLLAAFAIGGSNLLWQTAGGRALSTGICAAPGCPLLRAPLPGFTAAHAPG